VEGRTSENGAGLLIMVSVVSRSGRDESEAWAAPAPECARPWTSPPVRNPRV